MKRVRFLILILFIFSCGVSVDSYAQKPESGDSRAYLEIRKDKFKSGGVYYIDSFSERDLTPAPKGYKPFYICYYGRHGARYILGESQYTSIHKALVESRKAGALTSDGERFYAKFESIYPSLKLKAGDLTAKGALQLKELAKRMYRDYPEVFRNRPHAVAYASYLPRTILSMSSFIEGLREMDKRLDITAESSRADMPFLNPYSSLNPALNKWNDNIKSEEALWQPAYRKLCGKLIDPEAFLGRYFTDKELLKGIEPLQDLEMDIFDLASDMQCLDLDGDVSFYDLFTEEELSALWECENAKYYSRKGPDPRSYFRGEYMAAPILREIMEKSASDMSGDEIGIRILIGHDGCLMGLLSLMGADKWGTVTTNEDEIKNIWQSYNIPMAANLRFVFYKSKKAPDVLVKVLLNEKNLHLPVRTSDWPYYKWSDLRTFYGPVIAKADSALASCDSKGAPVILTGKVVADDGEPVAGVKVSDGHKIVTTDKNGDYRMYSTKEQGFVFITTPRNYVAVSKDGLQPDFYAHLTKPAWEPENHDFVLRRENQDKYSVIMITDLHLTNSDAKPDLEEFHNVAMPVIRRQADTLGEIGPVYSMNLGDLSHDLYWYRYKYNLQDAYNTLKEEKYPTVLYSVSGNHDNDGAVSTKNEDRDAEHLYRKVFGPEYYSIDIGKDHWVMMDDIIYLNTPKKKTVYKIKGNRDYVKGFTKAEMEWLANDLKYVSDTTNVYVCTHSPITFEDPFGINTKGTTFHRLSQMDSLNTIFKRFGKATIFCGHAHRLQIFDSRKYSSFHEYIIPALSGNMWTTSPNRELGVDGCDGGFLIGKISKDTTYFQLRTDKYGEKWLRSYDMNEVGRYYRNDPVIRKQMKMYPERRDYGKKEYSNYIYINFWYYRPGQELEVLENGKQLDVELTNHEDPLYNISYYVPKIAAGGKYSKAFSVDANLHMFRAKAHTKTGKILIRVLRPD
ncbi:MAG: calcineurin-like phosphoesterase C-terminal domain-containing protein, partial [Bacteroidales bacterium]|nr:calcineurin-like phosphoesterase C-terminal domain-containing protein [Bacteroidales bacterium]